jgi:hypothetical protein
MSGGLGMLLNILFSVDIKRNPSMAYPLIIVNIPLLLLVNPMIHFVLFNLLAIVFGLMAYMVSSSLLLKRYRNNIV